MIGNPIFRILLLLKLRWPLLVLAGAIAMLLTGTLSVFSPYLYQSSAVLEIVDESQSSNKSLAKQFKNVQTNAKFLQAVKVINSDEVLNTVAKRVSEEIESLPLIFPSYFSVTNIRSRLHYVNQHLVIGKKTVSRLKSRNVKYGPELTVKLLRDHLRIRQDIEASTIKITYTAATGLLAKRVCEFVVQEFLKSMNKNLRQLVDREYAFLNTQIDGKYRKISKIEEKLQNLFIQNPEVNLGNDGSKGLSPVAQRYIQSHRKVLEIDSKLKQNSRLLKRSLEALKSSDIIPMEIEASLRSQLIEEITKLEFRRVDLTIVRKLNSNHPSVRQLEARVGKLKKLLQGIVKRNIASNKTLEGVPGRSIGEIEKQVEEINKENIKLNARRERAQQEVNEGSTKLREAIELEFKIRHLMRKLGAEVSVVKSLTERHQSLSLQRESIDSKARLLLAPTNPLFPKNISIKKKLFFSFVSGAMFMVVIIVFLDLSSPILLRLSDLDELRMQSIGPIDLTEVSAEGMATYVASANEKGGDHKSRVSVFSNGRINFVFTAWVEEIAKILGKNGKKVAVVRVGFESIGDEETSAGIRKVDVHPRNLPFTIEDKMDELSNEYDHIFVVMPSLHRSPAERLVSSLAHQVYFVVKSGLTQWDELKSIKRQSLANFGVEYRCIFFAA